MASTIIDSKYEKIRDQCLTIGKPWEDPDFPANDTSIDPDKKSGFAWKRPHEICGNQRKPEFISDAGDRFDILQGSLGDCWMLAALASLTTSPQLLKKVVPHDQTFHKDKYAGVFRFHFWKFGEWVEVLVDDRLPMKDGRLVNAKFSILNEFWVPLLEKAYAKFHGSYTRIVKGSSFEALTDFTGCLTEIKFIKDFTPIQLLKMLLKAVERNSILSAGVDNPAATERGIPKNHAYSITGVKKVKLEDETEIYLVRVRNPWGDQMEWKGAWSDSSNEWTTISPEATQELKHINRKDGEFWIELSDFSVYFANVGICYLNAADIFASPEKHNCCWSISTFYGKWIKNKSGGGSYKNCPAYAKNPQFLVTLKDSDEDADNMASFVVELTQMNRRRQNLPNLIIGFRVFCLPPGAKPPMGQKLLGTYDHIFGQCRFDKVRAVTKTFTAEPGTYVIVPSTQQQNDEAEFMLRVFSETDHKSQAIAG